MTPPLIGITTYGRDENNKFYLRAEYVDSVRRACGLPVLLPPGDAHIQHLLRHLDGVILAGGGGLDPVLCGGSRAGRSCRGRGDAGPPLAHRRSVASRAHRGLRSRPAEAF